MQKQELLRQLGYSEKFIELIQQEPMPVIDHDDFNVFSDEYSDYYTEATSFLVVGGNMVTNSNSFKIK